MNKLLLVMAVFLLVGVVNAANWNPTVIDPNTGAADWGVAANWSTNAVPDSTVSALFKSVQAECRVTGSQEPKNIKIGNGGNAGVVRLMPGATLITANGHNYVGDTGVGHMVIERGALWDLPTRLLRLGYSAAALGSSLEVNGGTLTIESQFVSSAASGGGADVSLNAGLIDAERGDSNAAAYQQIMVGEDNTFDISFGTLIVHRDITEDVAEEVAAGRMTAFGEPGGDGIGAEIVYDYDGEATTVTATGDPLERFPTYDDVVQPGLVDLSWVNLEPNPPGGQVWVDVWFGSDPNTPFPDTWDKVVDAETTDTVQVSAPVGEGGLKEYIWQVITYRYGDPAVMDYENDPNLVVDEGMVMYFVASDDEPPSVVMDTPPTATWIDEPTPLQATVYDDGKSAVTVTWTSDEDPNAVFDPPTTVIPAQASYQLTGIAVTTSVTVDYQSGTFTVTATVSDLNPLDKTDSGTVEHHCSGTPCGATRNQVGLAADHPDDIDGDCMHDLADYGAIAEYYGTPGYALTEPQVIP